MWPFRKKIPVLPEGMKVVNISPDGCEAFYEACGPLVDRYFRLNDRIKAAMDAGQHAKAKKLALEAWSIAPYLRAAEVHAAKLNRVKDHKLSCPALEMLNSLAYQAKDWPEVVRIHGMAVSDGWNTEGMEARTAAARRKLQTQSPS